MADLERVLAVEPHVEQPRDDAVERHAGALRDGLQPRFEHRRVAAELVDDKGLQQRPVVLVEQRPRAVERGEDAAAVDVADDHDRQSELAGEAHVDVVTRAEVDLGRGAGALTHDELVGVCELAVGGERGLGQVGAPGGILPRLEGARWLAAHDDERPAVGARLEQDGVHRRRGLEPGRLRLEVLRPADLAAVEADHRVVRHVLRLEGRDLHPAPRESPAQSRDDDGLAGVGRRAGDEEAGRGRAGRRNHLAILPDPARPRPLRAAPRARLGGLGVQRLEGQLTPGRRRRAGGRACAGSP